MGNEIHLIKAIVISSKNYTLKIEPLKDNLDLPILTFEKENLNWKYSNNDNRNLAILNEKNQRILENREGIWFSEGEDIFFSKVCLFEQTDYKFIFNKNYNLKETSNDIIFYLREFFEAPIKWFKEGGNRERRIDIKIIEKGTYLLNFRSYTGKLRIKKEFVGYNYNDIEIITKKLTKKNYVEILEGLNEFLGQIFFKFQSPTDILANIDYIKAEIGYPEQWVYPLYIILRMIMKELSIYFSGVKNHINSKFIVEQKSNKGFELSNPSNIDFIKTVSNPENIYLINSDDALNYLTFPLNSVKFTFMQLVENIKKISYDTVENRFIKFVLDLILYNLNVYGIQKLFKTQNKQSDLEEFRSSLIEKVNYFERLDIKSLQRIPYSSQILQKNSYYRKFFQYFMWLQNPIVFNIQNLFFIDIKPMHELYEFYCLYKIKEALDLLVDDENIPLSFPDENHIIYEPNFDIKEYFAIKYIIIKYNYKDNREIHLIYKPNYLPLKNIKNKNVLESYSTNSSQNPDFIIAEIKEEKIPLNRENNINSMIIIDSKYRKDPAKLWKTVHFYKDALNAKGSVFINPLIKERDAHHKESINLMTPLGNELNGFVSAINLLGLIENENKFKPFFKEIFLKYF